MESAQQVTGGAGVSASQANVFEAHAAPQGLCENMTTALEQLAKQQKDGGSPIQIQSIVTGFCERSRKGLMEGLRNFTKVDNHCALDGHLNEGMMPFEVRRPKFKERCPRRQSGNSPGIDAESGGSWLPEIVHQCRSHSGGQVGTALGRR